MILRDLMFEYNTFEKDRHLNALFSPKIGHTYKKDIDFFIIYSVGNDKEEVLSLKKSIDK